MERPSKKGLDYFNIDCSQEDNLNFIEAKHGIVGYGVVIKIWKKIYQYHGYFCDWNEKNVYLFSKDVNVDVSFPSRKRAYSNSKSVNNTSESLILLPLEIGSNRDDWVQAICHPGPKSTVRGFFTPASNESGGN